MSMNDLLAALRADHDNLRKLLFLLEQLVVDLCRDTAVDFALLRRILVYFQDFPERVHHPAEDALFSVLLADGVGDEKLRENVRRLIRDHSRLEGQTRGVIRQVDGIIERTRWDIPALAAGLHELVRSQREHLMFEDMQLYPFIARQLDPAQWERIAALLPAGNDPLFGLQVGEEYIELSGRLAGR
jgi:hemerythrin-like domain-containing protein